VKTKTKGKLILLGGLALGLAVFALFFSIRRPVLVVTDEMFVALYGERRLKKRQLELSLLAGRKVKPVLVAEGAGPDILAVAIQDISSLPYCVIFPFRYAEGARQFYASFPKIPAILLQGRHNMGNRSSGFGVNSDDSGETDLFFEFFTDTELDYYRMGKCATIIGREKTGKLPVFQDPPGNSIEQDAFLKGFRGDVDELVPFFVNSTAHLGSGSDFPVAILSGPGRDFYDRNSKAKLLLFTWLEPSLTSRETFVIFDDSPWAQAAEVLKKIKGGQRRGNIPSGVLIFSGRIADNGVSRSLKKAARAYPEAEPGQTQLPFLKKNRALGKIGFDKKII
jgi:hypothetical protein